ncbi:hypothetical protein SLE2022_359600 [Rubroshorea leprosula]
MSWLSTYGWAVVLLVIGWSSGICYGSGTFGFDMHHRFSDQVKGILGTDNLPPKGSVEYYNAWANRDRMLHGRRLAAANDQTPLTFLAGNDTYRLDSLGHLHYANITVGTPALSYLVALDTGSNLFWLPCDCSSCVRGLVSSGGEKIEFNIYSPNTSTTSSKVPCGSDFCKQPKSGCPSAQSFCGYQVQYLSNGTSSTGILVKDVLHLITDDDQEKDVKANITFGCGQVQTGAFLTGAAPNGLFGLGMDNISVPSILAKENLASNSFSMCFGLDGIGRFSFGDKGSSDQGETPFNVEQLHPDYNVSVTQVKVGGNVQNLEFSAIFDSGTSFTYLNDPAYTLISESFNKLALDKRHASDSDLPFNYCYDLSANQTNFTYPVVNLTMKGGDSFFVNDPIVVVSMKDVTAYCLAIVKSNDVNIIGQNFMTGYRVVFDRENMILGWKPSDCYDIKDSNTVPVKPPTAVSPIGPVNPEATVGNSDTPQTSGAPPPLVNHSPQTHAYALMVLLVSMLALI